MNSPTTPEISVAQTTSIGYNRTGRIAVALISWILGSGGLVASLSAFSTFVYDVSPGRGASGYYVNSIALVFIMAWVFLAVLTVNWIRNRRCSKRIVIAATATGGISALICVIGFFTYMGALPLAFHLVFWRLAAPPNLRNG